MINLIVVVSLVFLVARCFVPSRPFETFSWPGTYEALAHIWVGFLIAEATRLLVAQFAECAPHEPVCLHRGKTAEAQQAAKAALVMLMALNAVEVLCFLLQWGAE